MDRVLLRTLLRGVLTPAWMAYSKQKAKQKVQAGIRAILLDSSLARGSEERREVRNWIATHEQEIMQVAGRVVLRDPKFITDDAVDVLMEDEKRVQKDVLPVHRTEAA